MFYNLKIYSNNSEFSLDSQDKMIIEREMDLYFSFFFGASNDFKTSIKQIDTKDYNSNLKSINEFENSVLDLSINNLNSVTITPLASKQTDNIKSNQQDEISITKEEIKNINENLSSFVQKDIEIKNLDDEIKIVNNPANELTLSDVNGSSASKNEVKTSNNLSFINEVLEAKNNLKPEEEVEDIISKAKDSLNMLDIDNEDDSVENLVELDNIDNVNSQNNEITITPSDPVIFQNENNIHDELKIDNNSWTDDLIYGKNENLNTNYDEDFGVIGLKLENNSTPIKDSVKKSAESKSDYDDKNDSSVEVLYDRDEIQKNRQSVIDDIFDFKDTTFGQNKNETEKENAPLEHEQPFEIQSETPKENMYHIPEENLYSITTTKLDETDNEPSKIDLEIPNETSNEKKEKVEQDRKNVHDFGDFLGNFEHTKIADEFLICAYYVKNFTENENFTMKNINAKIFRATGKIAGMSILAELIEKEYIVLVEDLDIKKYSITKKGEEYILNNLQK